METESNTRIKKLLADKFCFKIIIALLCVVIVITITIIMVGLIDIQPNNEYKLIRLYPTTTLSEYDDVIESRKYELYQFMRILPSNEEYNKTYEWSEHFIRQFYRAIYNNNINNTKKDIEKIEENFNSVKQITVEQKVVNIKRELKIFLNKEWLKVVNNQTNWKNVFCILLYNITCHFELWTE